MEQALHMTQKELVQCPDWVPLAKSVARGATNAVATGSTGKADIVARSASNVVLGRPENVMPSSMQSEQDELNRKFGQHIRKDRMQHSLHISMKRSASEFTSKPCK